MTKIVTNNKPRHYIVWTQLTPQEQQEFSYLNTQSAQSAQESASFFRYRGQLFDIGDAVAPDPKGPLADWHGVYFLTYDSGVAFKWTPHDEIIVGHYYATS